MPSLDPTTKKMEFITNPLKLAERLADLYDFSFKKPPKKHWTFDPSKIKFDEDFKKMYDHAAFAEALGYNSSKIDKTLPSGLPDEVVTIGDEGEIYLDHDRGTIYCTPEVYEMIFIGQFVQFYFDPHSNLDVEASILRITKNFLTSLTKCKYHDPTIPNMLLGYLKAKDYFHFSRYFIAHYLGLWV